jgi:hypothetical protein
MRNLASSSNNDNYLEKSMVLLTKLRIESEKKIACDCDLSIGTIQAECKSSTSTEHIKDFDELVIGQLMGDYKLKNLLLKYNHSMAEEIHRVIP